MQINAERAPFAFYQDLTEGIDADNAAVNDLSVGLAIQGQVRCTWGTHALVSIVAQNRFDVGRLDEEASAREHPAMAVAVTPPGAEHGHALGGCCRPALLLLEATPVLFLEGR